MPGPFAHLTDPLGPALLAGTALAAPGLTAPPTVQVAPPPAAPQAAAQAEADDPDAAAEKPKGKARKAKKAKDPDGDGDDDSDEEGDDDNDREELSAAAGPVRAARLRERARCAAIFTAAPAGGAAAAARIAFGTDLPRSQAAAVLKDIAPAAAPPATAQRPGLAARMEAAAIVTASPDPAPAEAATPDSTALRLLKQAGKL